MKIMSKGFAKAAIATVAAGAMAVTSAAPAFAQSRARDRRDNDGISAGEIIAGALIIGGIAAVASAAGRDGRDRYRGNDRYDDRYDHRGGNSRSAVEQ